jgi:Yip1 domain
MNAALRAHAMLADPAAEWLTIEDEPNDVPHLLTSYVALLALIPALSSFIGACVVGVVVPAGGTERAPFVDGLFGTAFSYVMTCAAVLVVALIIDRLAPAFSSRRGYNNAFKLAVYSYTPLWLAGIFLLVPGLRFLVLSGFYGAYLLWTGLPRLMQTPGPKVLPYTAAIVAWACVLTLVIAVAQHAMFGLSVF